MAAAKDKAPKGSDAAGAAKKPGRLSQLRAAYTVTRRGDPRIGWVLLGTFVLVFGVILAIGFLVDSPIYLGIFAFLTAMMVTLAVFARRAERAAFAQLEGQLGAAAAALQSLRRGWVVTPAVAATRDQALVHRAVGRPGVVLVGEGPRVGTLLSQEKKKYARVLPDVPVYDYQAGNGSGQVPLRKLTRELMKLPRNLKAAQVSDVEKRLKAIGTMNVPIPKGPLPKGMRMPRSPKPPRPGR